MGGYAPCIPAHYFKAGWHDFDPTSNIPHLAVLELEMVEPKVMCVASMRPDHSWQGSVKNQDRIYDPAGIAPTLHCCGGGNLEPKIMQTASADGHCVYEGKTIIGYTRDSTGNVLSYHERGMAGTLHTSSGQGGNTDQFVKELRYRIRKLTPRECFRLMGVDDADIDRIDAYRIKKTLKDGTVKEKPISKSAKYKLAGNSIVVDVLYHLFHQMFIAEPSAPASRQYTIFDYL